LIGGRAIDNGEPPTVRIRSDSVVASLDNPS
jgi:hypothetical protein